MLISALHIQTFYSANFIWVHTHTHIWNALSVITVVVDTFATDQPSADTVRNKIRKVSINVCSYRKFNMTFRILTLIKLAKSSRDAMLAILWQCTKCLQHISVVSERKSLTSKYGVSQHAINRILGTCSSRDFRPFVLFSQSGQYRFNTVAPNYY